MSGKSHSSQANNPLHGITLKTLLTELVEEYGWETLGQKITINCFTKDPSINSSLKFLRKNPWAREKVEVLYLKTRGQTHLPAESVWKWKS
jgi:uncharacterized protein (DUF2132 family)